MSGTITIFRQAPDAAACDPPLRLRSKAALVKALAGSTRRQVWVSRSQADLSDLMRAIAVAAPRVRAAYFISYAPPVGLSGPVLEAAFGRVILGAQAMIDVADLRDVLGAKHPEDYCIAAGWDEATDTLALWRGDLSVVLVPMTALPARRGVSPDPSDLSIEDCGQTVRLGGYEVSVDAVLFERDERYRRRAKKRMIREQQGLGPSIRRLRLMRGVPRTDFPGVAERTLARIEQGEVERAHHKTLERIAKRLGVAVEQLGEF